MPLICAALNRFQSAFSSINYLSRVSCRPWEVSGPGIIPAAFRGGTTASERQSDLSKVTLLFDVKMRRGRKSELKKKRKLVEVAVWVAESRNKNGRERFCQRQPRGFGVPPPASGLLKYLTSGAFSSLTVIRSVAGAQSNLWLGISKTLGSINRGMVLTVREVIISV